MPKSFNCPTCAAPLGFKGKTIQDCDYCGGRIIVPAEMFQNRPFQKPRKVLKVGEAIEHFFSGKLNQNYQYVIDLRSNSRRAQQQVGKIHSKIQDGHTDDATRQLSQTFGFSSSDAQTVVNRMSRGKGVDVSNMRLYPSVPVKSSVNRIVKILIGSLIAMVVLPFIFTLMIFLILFFMS